MPKPWKEKMKRTSESLSEEESSAVNDRAIAFLSAELGTVPEVDLHGYTKSDAIHFLDHDLHSRLAAGTEVVRVIYGRGEGKLRQSVLDWLADQRNQGGLVVDFEESNRAYDKGAAVVVVLEKTR